jgi:hypothetical protein
MIGQPVDGQVCFYINIIFDIGIRHFSIPTAIYFQVKGTYTKSNLFSRSRFVEKKKQI